MSKFNQEAPSMLARDALYSLQADNLQPDSLFIGERALIYIHAETYDIYSNFW